MVFVVIAVGLVVVAGAALMVVRSVSGRKWDSEAVKAQLDALSGFLDEREDVLIPAQEADSFVEEHSRPLSHYYLGGAYKWAKRLGSARLPTEIEGFPKRCAERVHRQNVSQWERQGLAALVGVLHAAPETKYVSHNELKGAIEGSKGSEWRALHEEEFLEAHGLSATDIDDASRTITSRLQLARAEWNDNAKQASLAAHQDLFDILETHPLTDAQRTAVVTDEDATLVLAGAGTGKTSVITAKVCYLLQSGLASADEILVMAYNRKAAEELQERISGVVDGDVPRISTFHATGLSILRESGASNTRVADWASGDGIIGWMRRALDRMLADPGLRTAAISCVTMFGAGIHPAVDEGGEFKTLQGWMVKSKEEQLISNWLFLNGYWAEYEQPYRQSAASYHPDWTLTRGVYLEHFGIDRHGQTRPDIDAAAYTDEMAWKRAHHAQQGTTLLETFSFQFTERTWQAALETQLRGVKRRKNPPNPEFVNSVLEDYVSATASLCTAFLSLMKNAGMTVDRLKTQQRRPADAYEAQQAHVFLEVFGHLCGWYEQELERSGSIDFADMCNRATEAITAGRFRSSYKYVLVDEFQDITRARADMVASLLQSRRYSRVFAVGDDWQSIYRFAGGEIAVMTSEFSDYFGVSETCELDRTFRYTPAIGRLASEFVMRNPIQLPKSIESGSDDIQPGVVLWLYSRRPESQTKGYQTLPQGLTRIAQLVDKDIAERGDTSATVLLLARQNFRSSDQQHLQPANATVEFQSMHSSKGLEADYVVVLGMTSGSHAFPSGIVEHPILDLARSAKSEMAHGEERRLFYVALTRARRRVYLMVDTDQPSPFATEIASIGRGTGDIAIARPPSQRETGNPL